MAKPKRGVNKVCSACNSEYYVPTYRSEVSRFCSLRCQNHTQYEVRRYKFICFTCKKECADSPSRIKEKRKYCSRECLEVQTQTRKQARLGASTRRRLRMGNISSKALRNLVWQFKDKICEQCSYREYDFCLDIHHLDGNPANNHIENIKVLCVICHRILHKKK